MVSVADALAALEAAARDGDRSELPSLLGGLRRVEAVGWARLVAQPAQNGTPATANTLRYVTQGEVASLTSM